MRNILFAVVLILGTFVPNLGTVLAQWDTGLGDMMVIDVNDSLANYGISNVLTVPNISTVANAALPKVSFDDSLNTYATTFGKSLIDDAAASNARTTLGLGTSAVQDSNVITNAAKTLLDDVAISNMRTTLGLGNNALIDTTTITNFAKTFLDDVAATNVRSTLGLAIGTNVQAQSSTLDSINANTWIGRNSITTLGTIGTGTWNASFTDTDLSAIDAGTWTGKNTITTLGTIATGTWNASFTDAALTAIDAGTWTGANSITTLGTISAGTWGGTALSTLKGGTGAASAAGARDSLGLAIGTNVQAYSANMDTDSTNDMLSAAFPDSGTALINRNTTTYTRTLLDDANEATFKATVNLESGVDFQAYDADLTTYAGITPAADMQSFLAAANDAAGLVALTAMGAASFRDSLNAVVDYRNIADSSFIAYDPPLLLQAGMAIKFGDIVYQNKVSKKLYTAMGDSLDSTTGLYLCVLRSGGAADAWVTVLTAGVVKFTPWTGVTTDSTAVYVSPSAAGAPTMVRPSTTGQWSAVIGRALTTDVLLFKPADVQLKIQ